jgi:hypothetical protein
MTRPFEPRLISVQLNLIGIKLTKFLFDPLNQLIIERLFFLFLLQTGQQCHANHAGDQHDDENRKY